MVRIRPIGVICGSCAVIIANGDDSMYDIHDETTAQEMRDQFDAGLAKLTEGRHVFVGESHDCQVRKNPFRVAGLSCACFDQCDICGENVSYTQNPELYELLADMEPMLGGFRVGSLVVTHPASDAYMRGARYGEVVKVGRKYLYVHLPGVNAREKPWRFLPENLLPNSTETTQPSGGVSE